MSSTAHRDPVSGSADQEAGIDIKKIIAVGVVSLSLFGISAVVAGKIVSSDTKRLEAERGIAGEAKYLGQPEVNIVEQVHYDADTRVAVWKQDIAKRQNGYGWVDRKAGTIHVPVESVYDRVIAEAAAGGGAAPTPAPAAEPAKPEAKPEAKPAAKPAETKTP